MTLLVFLRFWEVLIHILHYDKWPGKVVYVADDLDTRGFGWEDRCCMEVSDCELYAWELVDVVDCFLCCRSCRVFIEQINVLQHRR